MPLQNLYQEAPLKDYISLGPGAMMGLGQESFNQALGRQRERDSLVDIYNQQAVDGYNPAEISRMGLANRQQEYMMPTYEAQGMAAQAKMGTPGYFDAAVQADMTGYGATTAENINKKTTATAIAPYAGPIAKAKAMTAQDTAQVETLYNALGDPRILQAPDAEVMEWIEKRMPGQAKSIQAGIQKAGGWAKFAPTFRAQLLQQIETSALSSPEYLRAKDLEASKPSHVSLQDWQAYLTGDTNTRTLLERMWGIKHPPMQPSVTTSTSSMRIDPETGLPIKVEETVKGAPTGAEAASKASPTEAQKALEARKANKTSASLEPGGENLPVKKLDLGSITLLRKEKTKLEQELDKVDGNWLLPPGNPTRMKEIQQQLRYIDNQLDAHRRSLFK